MHIEAKGGTYADWPPKVCGYLSPRYTCPISAMIRMLAVQTGIYS